MRRFIAAAFAVALALPAWATSIRLMPLSELVSEAEQVLQGRVVSSKAVQDGSIIVTEYEVDVSDWLKPGPRGRAGRIVVRQPGGTVGDVTMTVEGAAHFAVGDEVILFTRDYGGQGHQQVANLAQGALPLAPAAAPPGQAVAAARRRVPQASGFPGGAPEDLDTFKARVRELVAGRLR